MYRMRSSRNRKNMITLFEYRNGLEFIVFDVETTGLNKKHDDFIIELAAQKYRIENRKPVLIDQKDIYIKPPFWMSEDVIAIHHITNEYLEDMPEEADVVPEIQAFFGKRPILVAQNAEFDIQMMEEMFERMGSEFTYQMVFDTLECARDLVSPDEMTQFLKEHYDGKELLDRSQKPYQLSNVTKLYGLDDGINFHNALGDVNATARLLMVFYEEYKKMPSRSALNKLKINYIFFYGKRKEQIGVWVDTDMGRLYFSTLYKAWMSSGIDLETVDIDCLEDNILHRMNISFKEFARMTEKKFAKGGYN